MQVIYDVAPFLGSLPTTQGSSQLQLRVRLSSTACVAQVDSDVRGRDLLRPDPGDPSKLCEALVQPGQGYHEPLLCHNCQHPVGRQNRGGQSSPGSGRYAARDLTSLLALEDAKQKKKWAVMRDRPLSNLPWFWLSLPLPSEFSSTPMAVDFCNCVVELDLAGMHCAVTGCRTRGKRCALIRS